MNPSKLLRVDSADDPYLRLRMPDPPPPPPPPPAPTMVLKEGESEQERNARAKVVLRLAHNMQLLEMRVGKLKTLQQNIAAGRGNVAEVKDELHGLLDLVEFMLF